MRKTSLLISAAALLAGVSTSHATLFAYEGFDAPIITGTGVAAPGGTALNLIDNSGSGFTGAWTVTSGSGGASVFESAGLAYPGGYLGTNVAVGGNGRATGAPGDNAFLRLNFNSGAATSINGAPLVVTSFLAQRVGTSVTDAGALDAATRTEFNLVSEYPRNFGARFMSNSGVTDNSSLGTIGKPSTWGINGETYPDDVPSITDTWGVGSWKDTHNEYTGESFSDGVDHVVVVFYKASNMVELYVNPQADGTNDGFLKFTYTDGGNPVPMDFYAFGVEAGNDSSDRPVGDFVFDEIRVADSWSDAAGIVPEPSTYAAILGFLALAFVFVRRRRNK